MKERRTSKLKQKQQETRHLEDQTEKMESKLAELKKQIQEQKKMRTEISAESTVSRWQKTTKQTKGPLQSHAKQILEEQKQAYAQFGINQKKIYGTKTFEGALKKIKVEKEVEEDRNPKKTTTFLKEANKQESPPKAIVENNFFKAKMDVKKLMKQKTLEDFLEENFILEYLRKFNEEGIQDIEGLRYVSKAQLNDMGVKMGHQVKIIKKVREEFDKMLAGKVEEEPKTEKEAEQSSEKVEFGYGQGDVNSYNDAEIVDQQEEVEVSDIKLESKIAPQEEDYQDQEQDVVMITAPTQSIELQVSQPERQRQNCYECYKSIEYPELHYDEKYFCGQLCLQKFMVMLRKTCPACGKGFIKTEGYREEGLWFCSLGCCPNREEIEQMFFQWHQDGK